MRYYFGKQLFFLGAIFYGSTLVGGNFFTAIIGDLINHVNTTINNKSDRDNGLPSIPGASFSHPVGTNGGHRIVKSVDAGTIEPESCTSDIDNDTICDDLDNCLAVPNPTQSDTDTDGLGNLCDICPTDPTNTCIPSDIDGDGVLNSQDNCPGSANPAQMDTDSDGIGDACDNCVAGNNTQDIDNDKIPDLCDPCPTEAGVTCVDALTDSDNDGVPDDWDNCISQANADQANFDGDSFGNACDGCTDIDGDGVGNAPFPTFLCPVTATAFDNCPFFANPVQADSDSDGLGDICDICPEDATNSCGDDTDQDGVNDDNDNCPLVPNSLQRDTDSDGIGDLCDTCTDTDRDGAGDFGFNISTCTVGKTQVATRDLLEPKAIIADNCPFEPNPDQSDIDGDGIGDPCDICPFDIDLNCAPDQDFDDDGVTNAQDNCIFIPNSNQSDVDNDDRGDACDVCPAGNNNDDEDGDGIADKCDFCLDDPDNDCFHHDHDDVLPVPVIPGPPLLPPVVPPAPLMPPAIAPPGGLPPTEVVNSVPAPIAKAPDTEASVPQKPANKKKPYTEEQNNEKSSGCSHRGPTDAFSFGLFAMVILSVRARRVRKS